ncbi:sigma 54-interacting transcriptional regulator [Virgibacillus halophilus]|uniref:Sigma 54-interacting transcriptional regulator n=1 Tax=Tigheibacillus halophilus TaxID=361280 RepID=A0ABU5CB05_9BACI|nr:sigma 54-interacting transcriptional regulator [Virgibacillus halophilus]
MKKVLIIGAGKGGSSLLKTLHVASKLQVAAVIDRNPFASGVKLAEKLGISVSLDWEQWLAENHASVDIVIDATGDEEVLAKLMTYSNTKTQVIPGSIAHIISDMIEEKEDLLEHMEFQSNNQKLILDIIRDGMIVVSKQGRIEFINNSAENIVGVTKTDVLGKDITTVIENSRLPDVLRTRQKEINQKLNLENGRRIITTRMPIINDQEQLLGAFAIFKDISEILDLAEENTDLKEIKTMLEAIIQSSEEAISVVDENGTGIMINPAYTRITGLAEKDVVGKPATVDISEGESVHMKVLETRRPIRDVRMKVGPVKKDVMVNAAPVIVDGKLKGSVGVLHDVSKIQSLTSELKRARQIIRNLEAKYTFDDIIGASSEMRLALEKAKVGARTPATVLLRGESGTGKELFAHAIHNESERKHRKFIRVNCAALSEAVLESELFGYEEGAFTGAKRGGKIGLFEEANQGSIFLDEIGELSHNMQAKLLRVLQENEILRVGGTTPIMINVRVIAATNVNLEKSIMAKTFREDLYYRLNKLPIFIPSLRERLSDLPELIHHLIQKLNQDYGRNVKSISEEAIDQLYHYDWPGNVRELENVIGRAMIYMDISKEIIETAHLPNLSGEMHHTEQTVSKITSGENKALQDRMDAYEKEVIAKAYKENNHNKTKTARALQISIRNLYYKLEKYRLE